jgi:hypothetical protein
MSRCHAAISLAGVAVFAATVGLPALPSIYPTGTTIYDPAKAWSGYTLFDTPEAPGAVLVDMNGAVVKQWDSVALAPVPFRILPGGYFMGATAARPPHQETLAVSEFDWNGREMWRFDRVEQVQLADKSMAWAARQHHDWQREGYPAGYYAPGGEPLVDRGKTLILSHRDVRNPAISDKTLEDDYLLEVSWDGKVLWEWLASDHVDEFGFSAAARKTIRESLELNRQRGSSDWLHVNAASYVGPNRWYDSGDQRFNPENVLLSSREASFIAIVDRRGAVVWRMGPDYRESPALMKLGQIIGQHNPHIIPKGLPGAGNLLVFDNGGASGYEAPSPGSPTGVNAFGREYSRVLEVNPVTFDKVWEYSVPGQQRTNFLSHYVGNAQRLVNGNTLINEGANGRIFEVTSGGAIVWEYVSPFFGKSNGLNNRIFRAYRVPYDWVPQAPKPRERPVVPPKLGEFHIAPQ